MSKKFTDIEWIEEVINAASICRLGMVDGDEPYVIPVNFGYERGFLYFHSGLKGRKVKLLEKNNKICFEFETDIDVVNAENPCESVVQGKSVIGSGTATFLEDDKDKIHALNVLMKHYTDKSDYEFSESALASVLVVRIAITSMTGKQIE